MKAVFKQANKRDVFKRWTILSAVMATLGSVGAISSSPAIAARDLSVGYQGVEFYGSSLVTRNELEQLLGLKQGASYEQLIKALPKFKSKLDQRHIHATVDVASENGKHFVTVDIVDIGTATVPVRRLINAHRVPLSSEVPFQVMTQLLARREQLAAEGRHVTESYDDRTGLKYFSDEPCNQFADKLHKQVPAMQREFLEVVAADPDQDRRSKAIELLNWTSDPIILCGTFIPVVDDASEQVRASVARFIFPRIKMLPDNYPYLNLVEVFTHQLARPSHVDRVLALKCLCEIARRRPETIDAIREFNEDKIKMLAGSSSISTIRDPANQLLTYCAHPPARPQAPKLMPNEF